MLFIIAVKLLHNLINENQALLDLAKSSNLQIPDTIVQQQSHQEPSNKSNSPESSISPGKTLDTFQNK